MTVHGIRSLFTVMEKIPQHRTTTPTETATLIQTVMEFCFGITRMMIGTSPDRTTQVKHHHGTAPVSTVMDQAQEHPTITLT